MLPEKLYNSNTKILRTIFFTASAKRDPEWKKLFNFGSPPDNRPTFEDLSIAEFSAAPSKNPGDPIVMDNLKEAYSTKYSYITLALGYQAPRETTAHDQHGVLKMGAQLLAYSMFIAEETRIWNMVNLMTSANVLGGDGKPLCDTAHPLKKGGTASNLVASTAFSSTAYENAKINFRKTKSDANNFSEKTPKFIVGGLDMDRKFKEVKRSPKEPYTTDNQLNVHLDDGIEILTTKWITSTTLWALFGAKAPTGKDGRIEFEPDAHRCNVVYFWDNHFDSDEIKGNLLTKYFVDKRFTYGFSDWRGVYGSQGA